MTNVNDTASFHCTLYTYLPQWAVWAVWKVWEVSAKLRAGIQNSFLHTRVQLSSVHIECKNLYKGCMQCQLNLSDFVRFFVVTGLDLHEYVSGFVGIWPPDLSGAVLGIIFLFYLAKVGQISTYAGVMPVFLKKTFQKK